MDTQVLVQESGGTFEVLYDYNSVRWLAIECLVPNVLVKQVHGESKNSTVTLDGLTADHAILISKNASIKAYNLNCHSLVTKSSNGGIYAVNVKTHDLDLQTSNSRIEAENVKAHIARLTTSNAKIGLENIDAAEVYVKTSNASVKLDNVFGLDGDFAKTASSFGSQYPAGHEKAPKIERVVDIRTSNASISVGVPDSVAVKLQASTSNGGVQCKLPNLIAHEVSKSYFNGQTYDYESQTKQAKLTLASSNGTIKIKEV